MQLKKNLTAEEILRFSQSSEDSTVFRRSSTDLTILFIMSKREEGRRANVKKCERKEETAEQES